tara:strand:- start:145871 stop:146572 length:702 start_codon:yes stop_codon:yes gene_type:complete
MIDFITKHFNFIVYFFELIAFITGVILFKKHKSKATKIFIFFLAYIVFVEFVGCILTYLKANAIVQFVRQLGVTTRLWYNVFWLFGSVVFILFYYYNLFKIKMFKTMIKYISLLYVLIFTIHVVFNYDAFFNAHHTFYFILDASIIFICVTLFCLELLKSDDLLNISKSFSVYATFGLFLWWLVTTPIIFYESYNTTADWDFANLKRRVFLFANIFMYTCFVLGLIASKPQKN